MCVRAARLAAQLDQQPDRAQLHVAGARRQVGGVSRASPVGWAARVELGVNDQRQAEAREDRHGRLQVGARHVRELVEAGVRQEALEPDDAASASERLELARDCRGRRRPRKPRRPRAGPLIAANLVSSAARLVVTGEQLSGMSTMVAMPPAAAAAVAVAKPSHSVRPGSLTWTCVSTRAGITAQIAGLPDRHAGRDLVGPDDGGDLLAFEQHGGGLEAFLRQNAPSRGSRGRSPFGSLQVQWMAPVETGTSAT